MRGALIGAAASIGLCVTAPTASAQFGFYVSRDVYDDAPLMPPRAVAYRLYDRGFTEVSRPRFDGTAYVVDATNPAGARVRLFVDAGNGAIIGRRPLDVPYYPSAREARPVPGYGWTEEDVARRRTARAGEGLVPPADIPSAAPSRPSKQAALGAEASPRVGAPEANPLGVNPDGKARPATIPKKSARLNPPQKPVIANAAPIAPAPKIEAAEAAKPEPGEPKREAATAAPPNSEPKAEPSTPAANQDSGEKPAAEAPKAEPVKDASKQDQAWREPSPEESKRKVRVINGATVVPGQGETSAAATN